MEVAFNGFKFYFAKYYLYEFCRQNNTKAVMHVRSIYICLHLIKLIYSLPHSRSSEAHMRTYEMRTNKVAISYRLTEIRKDPI